MLCVCICVFGYVFTWSVLCFSSVPVLQSVLPLTRCFHLLISLSLFILSVFCHSSVEHYVFSHHDWFLSLVLLCDCPELAILSDCCHVSWFILLLQVSFIFLEYFCFLKSRKTVIFFTWDLSSIVHQSNLVFPVIGLWSCCGINIAHCPN